jgi:glyoxylase-like metal-dependent hydrolase (beta-lactamase superfamily II)
LANAPIEGPSNVYLLDWGTTTALIDAGDMLPISRDELEDELAAVDVSFTDIDEIFLTHWHQDHVGQAAAVYAESDATVRVHVDDAPFVSGGNAAWTTLRRLQEDFLANWGVPDDRKAALDGLFREMVDKMEPVPVEPFEDGDIFSVGDAALQVVHMPGHTAGMSAFAVPETGEVFSGDALLPEYTPNVGGADLRVERPLERYLDTLLSFSDFDGAWPGHREPIDRPVERAQEIVDHHERRAWRVLDIVREHGPVDTWGVATALFGDLQGPHILQGAGESYAHLDHLHRQRIVERSEREYTLRASTIERMEQLSGDSWPLVERSTQGTPVELLTNRTPHS